MTPAANQTGTTTVTLTVTDGGGLTATDTFVLTVTAVNDAPTISNIADQTTNEDTAKGPVAFTIGDLETAVGSLAVAGTSSNKTLLPDANILCAGTTASRTVTMTPAANQTGTTTVTLTVTDGGGLSATDTFVLTVTAVNDAPTISNIADQSTPMNTAKGPVSFTIGDVDTAATSLTLTGGSSNTTLLPVANIVFGGSGTSRTVTLTPATGQTGTATVTVTVSDGSLSASDTFVLTVTVVNTAPTISDIADQTTSEDTAKGPVAFTIGDAETAAASLTLSRTSSNTTLLPVANIVFGGSGASRTVTLTPAANQSGTATVTVTVSDGSLSASDSFTLTVSAVNDVPTVSNIADQSTPAGTAKGPIAFTVGDLETAAGSLTVTGSSSNTTLLPNANIVLGGSGASRTITLTPAAGQTGTATVTVTVSDGSLSASDTFVLTVTGVPAIELSVATLSPSCRKTTNAAAQSFTVRNAGTGTLSWSVSDNQTWLACAPASGASTGELDTVTVTYSTAGLAEGTYPATITVAGGTGVTSQTIAVTLTVTKPGRIKTSAAALAVSCKKGASPAASGFTVANEGVGTMAYTLSVDQTWMSCAPASGTCATDVDSLAANYAAGSLATGTYTGTITIAAPDADNSPLVIPVTLTVKKPSSGGGGGGGGGCSLAGASGPAGAAGWLLPWAAALAAWVGGRRRGRR